MQAYSILEYLLDPGKDTLLPIMVRLTRDPDYGLRALAVRDLMTRYPDEARQVGVSKKDLYPPGTTPIE